MEQPQYNLFERFKMEQDYLPVFRNVGLGTTIWSPLASGFLTGKYLDKSPEGARLGMAGFEWLKDRWLQQDKIEKLKKLAALSERMGISLAALSIAWTLRNPHVTTAILGATSREQLHQNLKAMEVLPLLTDGIMTEIDQIMQNKPVLDLA
jgi:aryl-alcohol dehydrogenase-like predicted oxidoreductase